MALPNQGGDASPQAGAPDYASTRPRLKHGWTKGMGMARKRGKRWTASGYDKALKRKVHLGTYATKREALAAEADHRLKGKPTGAETCDQFAERWMRDFPRPRKSTTMTNEEHTKAFARDFKGIKLGDVDRPTARAWALKHRHDLTTVRAMFGDALRDGLVPYNPFAELRIARGRGRKDIVALTESELMELADLAVDRRDGAWRVRSRVSSDDPVRRLRWRSPRRAIRAAPR